jgi:L-threonylcarbamoyladenylate synthase
MLLRAEREAIERGAEILRRGGLVAFPTETVYGLGANALDSAAVARIYAAKGRPGTSPLIVHVSSVEMARGLTSVWPEAAAILAREYWPGPLTLVLPKNERVPEALTAGFQTVGLRWPAHPVAQALIEAAGLPVAAPSANRFTELSPTSAAHVERSLGQRVELILDGGPTQVGIESTVLSLAGEMPVLLRPGMITRGQLEKWIGPVAVAGKIEGAHPSPGMHERHYSPSTPLYLVQSEHELPTAGRGLYLSWGGAWGPAAEQLVMPRAAHEYAEALYAALHSADRGQWDWIAVERPPASEEWAGVLDRLQRASIRRSNLS